MQSGEWQSNLSQLIRLKMKMKNGSLMSSSRYERATLTSPAKRRRGEPFPPRLVEIRVDPSGCGIDQLDGGVRYRRAGTRILCWNRRIKSNREKDGCEVESMGQPLSLQDSKREEEERISILCVKICCDPDLLIGIHLCRQGHPVENQLVLLTASAIRRLIPRHLQLDDVCPFPEASTRSQ